MMDSFYVTRDEEGDRARLGDKIAEGTGTTAK